MGFALKRTHRLKPVVYGIKLAQLLITAEEIQLFDRLSSGPAPAQRLASDLHLEEVYLRRVLNALVASSILLLSDDSTYSISGDWSTLIPGGQFSQNGYLRYAHVVKQCWGDLTSALRDEDVRKRNASLITGGNDVATRAFIDAMDANARSGARQIASEWDFSNHRILDVGGGSGIYLIEVTSVSEHVRGVVFDLPSVTSIAEERIAQAGLNENIVAISGDYNDTLPEGVFDDIVLFAVVHQQGPNKNKKLLRRIYEQLENGGRLFVTSFFTNEHGTAPPFAAYFAVEMTVMIPGGQVYTNAEMESMLKDAGFVEVKKIENILSPATLYIAKKPETVRTQE